MTNKKKSIFNSKERDIILYLYREGGLATPHKISKETGIAYSTVLKYLKILTEKKIISSYIYGTTPKITLENLGKTKHPVTRTQIENVNIKDFVKKDSGKKTRGRSIRYALNPKIIKEISK